MKIDNLKIPESEISEKISVEAYTGNEKDFFTAKMYPYKLRYKIQTMKSPVPTETLLAFASSKNMDISNDEVLEKALQDLMIEKPELLREWDGGFDYKLTVLENGIDPLKHSLVDDNERQLVLDRKTFEKIANSNPGLFDFLVAFVEDFNNMGE